MCLEEKELNFMDINLNIKDKIITILRVHMVKKSSKIMNTWMNCLTKTKKVQNIQKKKYTNQNFNEFEFPKSYHSSYIDKYIVY